MAPSLALGVRRHQTGVAGNGHSNPKRTTIFNRLQAAGYWTATCGKNDLHKGSNEYDDSGWVPRMARYCFNDAIDHRGEGECPWCGEKALDHANLRRLYAASCEGIDECVDASLRWSGVEAIWSIP